VAPRGPAGIRSTAQCAVTNRRCRCRRCNAYCVGVDLGAITRRLSLSRFRLLRMGKPGEARARELGTMLQRRRERAGLSMRALGAQLGWPATKICRAELGQRPISE